MSVHRWHVATVATPDGEVLGRHVVRLVHGLTRLTTLCGDYVVEVGERPDADARCHVCAAKLALVACGACELATMGADEARRLYAELMGHPLSTAALRQLRDEARRTGIGFAEVDAFVAGEKASSRPADARETPHASRETHGTVDAAEGQGVALAGLCATCRHPRACDDEEHASVARSGDCVWYEHRWEVQP